MHPTTSDSASVDTWLPVRRAAARAGVLAVLALALVVAAFALDLALLRATGALALSVGIGSALVGSLEARRTLAATWAQLTAWIGGAFWLATLWNACWLGIAPAGVVDLALGAAIAFEGFAVARAARRGDAA